MKASEVRRRLKAESDPQKASVYPRFFKTGPGEYGEGDRFYGVTVPECRKIAKAAAGIDEPELLRLLRSPVHEEREVALLVMVAAFERASDEAERRRLFDLYVRERRHVNSWDLVDASAPTVVGGYLERHDEDRAILFEWAASGDLWERRIAMLATFRFIKRNEFTDALAIAEILKNDEHDLIHKAVGWMLREIGNRDRAAEERFLKRPYRGMPRTMLRYAIEKFPERRRQAYLKGRA